jgi:hypothetical protein
MASNWTFGINPVATVFFFLLAPPLLIACSIDGLGWTWWQRVLAGAGGAILVLYIIAVIVGKIQLRHNSG